MSRLASKPITLSQGFSCDVDGSSIKIKSGDKTSSLPFDSKYVSVKVENNSVKFSRNEDIKTPAHLRGLLGTTLALFKQSVKDLSSGYTAKLNFIGVGYKAQVVKAGSFDYLRMALGFSHPIFIFIPKGISIKMDKETAIVSGRDTQTVMQFCAKVRSQKTPTVYHGTGVIMNNEVVNKKVGKKK
jgi:large subunit ribosomal protein L6